MLETFEDGAEVAPGVTAVATHGHTPGHMSFAVSGGDTTVMVIGDAVGNDHVAMARPDWPSGADQDMETGAATRARLLDQLATDGMLAVGFHMGGGGLGRVERPATAIASPPRSRASGRGRTSCHCAVHQDRGRHATRPDRRARDPCRQRHHRPARNGGTDGASPGQHRAEPHQDRADEISLHRGVRSEPLDLPFARKKRGEACADERHRAPGRSRRTAARSVPSPAPSACQSQGP
jgi:hypothetical protein